MHDNLLSPRNTKIRGEQASIWRYIPPSVEVRSTQDWSGDLEKVEFLRGDVFRAILKQNNGLLDVPSPPFDPLAPFVQWKQWIP